MAKRMWVAVESSQLPGGPVMTTMAKGIDPTDPPAWMVEAGAKAMWKGFQARTSAKDIEFLSLDAAPEWTRRDYFDIARACLVDALSASEVRDSTDAQREQRR